MIDLGAARLRKMGAPAEPIQVPVHGMTAIGPFDLNGDCNAIVHWYESVPGRCKCGENFWDGKSDAEEGCELDPA